MKKQLFDLGQVVMTNSVASEVSTPEISDLVYRHVTGDFGDLEKSDIQMNKKAIETGEDRIFSSYNVNGKKVFVITEWDRSVTTVMLASDY